MAGKTTMQTVADALGVSKNTVSLALRNDPQISASTRKRVKSAAERLGYRRDPFVGEVMARLRSHPGRAPAGTLALLNAHQDPEAFHRHPTIPIYVEGCRRRADRLGYALDSFWMDDPALDGERLARILRTRGIRGVIVTGLMKENRLPEAFHPVWNGFPCVVTGVRTRDPALSFACTDHHILALRAFEKAIALGYKRPGLVLDRKIDRLVEGRFTAGYRTGQMEIPATRRLRPFHETVEATKNLSVFSAWLKKEKPDVLFTLYNTTRTWVDRLGYRVPEDMGLIQLERRREEPEWAGMDQHNDITGEAAVEMLIGMIHRGERGVPKFPRATLIGPTWMDGETA